MTGEDSSIDPRLLDLLLRARSPVPIARLCKCGNLSNARLSDELERLRDAGCRVEVDPTGHARLLHSGLGVWVDYLRWRGAGRSTVEVYRRTTSTQDVARRLIADHRRGAHGALVVADEQTAGRGRMGRHWRAPPGAAALLSYVWMTNTGREGVTTDRLLFAVAVAVCEALDAVSDSNLRDVRIRWPNDVLIEGRKVAGILVESLSIGVNDSSAAVIGIGVNVGLTQEQTRDRMADLTDITSLAMCGIGADRLLVVAEIVSHMERALNESDAATLLERWRRRSTVIDRHVTIAHNGKTTRGQVIDLHPHEGLIVRTNEGQLVHFPAETSTIMT